MWAPLTSSLVLVIAFSMGPVRAQTEQAPTAELERRFDASLDAREMAAWMRTMAAEPNHVGSVHHKANAEMVLAQFWDWGWGAHIETFEVLYPTPISETLELLGPEPFKATLAEMPIPGDETSTRAKDGLPAYVAYQGDGDTPRSTRYRVPAHTAFRSSPWPKWRPDFPASAPWIGERHFIERYD